MARNGRGRFDTEEERRFGDDEVVFSQGDRSRELYVVQSGAVRIERTDEGRTLTLATLQRGAIFGEMAFLESLPRSASARAVGETRLLVIQPGGLLMKVRRDPTLAFELLQQLSRRIRRTNERLAVAIQKRRVAPVARDVLQSDGYEGE